jgi:hypothetical protein
VSECEDGYKKEYFFAWVDWRVCERVEKLVHSRAPLQIIQAHELMRESERE